MQFSPEVREVIDTYAEGSVVVYGHPIKRYEAGTTTEIKLDRGQVLVHSEPDRSFTRIVRLDIVTGDGIHQFPVETQIVGNSFINPESTVLSGPQRWGVEPIGYMWGRNAPLHLAERLLDKPIQDTGAMVAPSLVNNIRSLLTP